MIRPTLSVVQLEDRTNPAKMKIVVGMSTNLVITTPVATSPPVPPPVTGGGTVVVSPPPPTSPPVTHG